MYNLANAPVRTGLCVITGDIDQFVNAPRVLGCRDDWYLVLQHSWHTHNFVGVLDLWDIKHFAVPSGSLGPVFA